MSRAKVGKVSVNHFLKPSTKRGQSSQEYLLNLRVRANKCVANMASAMDHEMWGYTIEDKDFLRKIDSLKLNELKSNREKTDYKFSLILKHERRNISRVLEILRVSNHPSFEINGVKEIRNSIEDANPGDYVVKYSQVLFNNVLNKLGLESILELLKLKVKKVYKEHQIVIDSWRADMPNEPMVPPEFEELPSEEDYFLELCEITKSPVLDGAFKEYEKAKELLTQEIGLPVFQLKRNLYLYEQEFPGLYSTNLINDLSYYSDLCDERYDGILNYLNDPLPNEFKSFLRATIENQIKKDAEAITADKSILNSHSFREYLKECVDNLFQKK